MFQLGKYTAVSAFLPAFAGNAEPVTAKMESESNDSFSIFFTSRLFIKHGFSFPVDPHTSRAFFFSIITAAAPKINGDSIQRPRNMQKQACADVSSLYFPSRVLTFIPPSAIIRKRILPAPRPGPDSAPGVPLNIVGYLEKELERRKRT